MANGLRFRIREFRDELDTLRTISAPFFDSGAEGVFRSFGDQIDALWNYPDGATATIRIEGYSPLRTRPSNGRYEHQGGGTFKSLHATFTAAWDLKLIGQPSRKASGNRCFEIAGVASTVTDLWVDPHEAPDRFEIGTRTPCCIASWRLEIGNMTERGSNSSDLMASPGPLFHAQVPRRPDDEVATSELWPHWLSVPRFHSLPFTPMLAIEFGLAEVFQEEWTEHVRTGAHGAMVKHWAKVHRDRLRAFFDWQKQAITHADAATPLVGLKEHGMQVDLLLG